jgi:hypothetical protein
VATRWVFLRLHAGAAVVQTTLLQGKSLVLNSVQADKFIKSTTAALEQQHGNRKTLQEMMRERKAMDVLTPIQEFSCTPRWSVFGRRQHPMPIF